MKKWREFRAVTALVLALVLTFGMLPVMSTPAAAVGDATGLQVSNKVADPETLHNWQSYYGDSSLLPDGSTGISTWKAGGVWTDKSVFASDEDITAAGLPTNLEDANAFLVALSALASNKQIVGQTSAPTDTMLVLDLSNSMDQSGSVDEMISAANESIHTLLQMNVNNRVGVVLYSGNTDSDDPAYTSSATVILPLDRYTTTTTTRVEEDGEQVTKYHYLAVTGTSDTTVSVAAGTRNSSNQKPTGSKNTNGGTYIQNGLYKAYGAFAAVTDKGVVQSGTQKGVQRTPIVILMSDGAPTIATTNYYNVGTSNTGDGTTTTDRITFLTQLTAAWIKSKISNHYNNTAAKFYTLGLDTSSDEDATAILYPSGSNQTLRNYWTRFNTGSTDGATVNVGGGQGNNRWNLTYQSAAEAVGMNYVDRYWAASNSSAMISAFKQIVEEIGLQSAYSATLVESGEADLDGYITVEDELGAMMQVKDIKGILLGGTLFTGQELAKSLNEGSLGSTANPTAYGDEFVATVKERLGVETSVAQQLIAAAYADNQLHYDASTGAYANYIGWYGDADNNYLGFWDKDTGFVATGAPDGAKYINQSYGFLGGVAGSAGATDMMHIIVMVHTDIATGHQTVLFRVPSALIPMITYKVDLEGNSLETATDLTLTVTEKDPIRLLYEVGLPDDVTAFNLEQKVAEYLAKDSSNHIHKNSDGSYTFYANSWGAVEEKAPDISELTDAEKQALTASVAESHFIPNTANERFYVLEDSVVYDSAHNVLTGLPTAGGEYYFARTIVNVTGANGAATAVTQYEHLSAATVANADNFQIVDGQCLVKAGTIRQTLSDLELEKSENRTDTIGYSDSLWVYVPGTDAEDYNVYSFLGNNGKLTVMPTTGIKVTKDLTEVAEGAAADEAFAITVTIDAEVEAPAVTDGGGVALTDYTFSVAGGKTVVTVQLADGESAYISGLPAGVTYMVTEAAHSKYIYTYTGATQTVAATFVEGVVTNEPVKPGSLYITKEVVHTHEGETFPTDYEFDIRVTFTDADGQPLANTTFAVENNNDPNLTSLTTDENGVITGKLKHGETAHILGIPAGTVAVVEEINIPENYTVAYRSRNATGLDSDNDGTVTIVSESNATVVATNTYTPKSTSVDLDIAGTKVFNAENNKEVLPGGAFNFKVQRWNGSAWVDLEGKTAQVSYEAQEDGTKTFTIADVLSGITFDRVGSYAFQVLEVAGSVANVTYDRTLYTFTVVVTDVSGQLTAQVKDLNNTAITDGSYDVTFTNTYHTAPVSIDIVKDVTNLSGNPDISKEGFQFVAVQTDENWNALTGELVSSLTVYSDAAGEARVSATYNEAGSYYYILSETDGGKPGWTYSDVQYKIEVKVTADEAGNLSATLIVDGTDLQADNASVSFTNTYDPDDAQVDLNVVPTVVKDLKGRDLVAGEFTFAIFPNNQSSHVSTEGAIAVGTNDEDGNVNFAPSPLTFSQVGKYEYDVVEITGDLGGVSYNNTIYDLVIEVTDKGDGTLEATYYFEDAISQQVSFENTYKADPTEAAIEGLKTVQVNSGLYTLKAGDFTFGLYQDGEKIAETSNLANGTFVFEAITYTAAGTYTYEIKEIAPDGSTDGSYSANGLRYSGQSFTVTVEVTDNGEGQLVAAVSSSAEEVEFVNTYASTPAYVSLSGNKTLAGRDLADGEFRFAIYRSNADFTAHELVTDQITNDAEGNVTFSFGSLGMGYHYFIIKEVIPAERAAGIHYDAGEYHVTVQVVDSGTGKMNAMTTVYHPGTPNEQNPSILFKNTYRPEDGSVIIDGSKIYSGKQLQAEDFSFELYQGDTLLDTAKVAADGTFAFETITYTADQIGSHTYTVKEVIPEGATQNADGTWTLGNITYDATVYTVVVTVEDVEGTLQTSKSVNGGSAAITFTNTFTPDPIDLTLEATKSYNKPLQGGDFTFTLEGEGFAKQEKTNDADGKVTFDPLTLTEAKTYTFTVKEKEEILWGFISWDKSEYTVEVVVENQNGQLVVTSQTVKVNEEAKDGGIVFTNEYVLDGEDSVVLTVQKTMTGDRTDPAGFLFGLYDAAGELLQTITSDADGEVSFQALTFDETHVAGSPYTYTVREILPTDDGNQPVAELNGVTYDQAVYTVVVTVADNGRGDVEATYTVDGNAADRDAYKFAFTNSYHIISGASVTIDGLKTYDGRTLQGNDFAFVLSQDGQTLQSVKNAADGTFAFEPIEYTKDDVGVHTYTVSELHPEGVTKNEDGLYVKDGIVYDANVYTVEVTVTDNGKGGLNVTKKVNNAEVENVSVTFDNAYQLFGNGTLELTGTKTLTGGKPLADGEFTFGLYQDGQLVAQAQNVGGNFVITKLYSVDELGEYTYTLAEVIPEGATQNEDGTWTLGTVTYDPTAYTVNVKVYDDQVGGIAVDYELVDAQAIAFENVYTPEPAVITIGVEKILENKTDKQMSLEGFEFVIALGDETYTAASDAEGKTGFTVTFHESDIGKTYVFEISEKNTGIKGMTYDKTVHSVTVQVLQNEDGTLSTLIGDQATDTVSLQFTNTYEKLVTPPTGDNFNLILPIALMLASILGVVAVVTFRKKKTA